MPRQTIESLQAGRGLAALAVVVHHSGLAAHDFGGFDAPLLSYGYLGVDFFFVLSGFIILHSTVGRGKSAMDYAASRLRRIYPPYWPVGVGIALLYVWLPGLSAGGGRAWSWLPTLTLLPVSGDTALVVAWTLKHEILFYALFGVAYFSGFLWPALIAWAAAIGVGVILGANAVPLRTINFEFLFGILACVATRHGRRSPLLLAGSVLAFSLWVALGAQRELSFLVGLAFALAIPPIVGAEWRGRLAVPAPLVFLGAASYSIYLVHPLFTPIAGRLLHGHAYAILGFGILGSLAVGSLYHLAVEKPLLGMSWSWLFPEKRSGMCSICRMEPPLKGKNYCETCAELAIW